jgi:hypothetical protein
MMCLGWMTRPECATRKQEQVTAPAACPNINWFWLALGAIGIGALSKQK